MNEKAIQVLVKSRGWQEVLKYLNDKLLKSTFAINIQTESLTAEQIALEVKSSKKAVNIIEELINDINKIANKQEIKKESWK